MTRACFLTCLAALLAPMPALAAPVTLVCKPVLGGGPDWTLPLDAEAGTVNGRSANFTSQQITWHDAAINGDYTLNRISGDLTITTPAPGGDFYYTHYSCQPGAAKF